MVTQVKCDKVKKGFVQTTSLQHSFNTSRKQPTIQYRFQTLVTLAAVYMVLDSQSYTHHPVLRFIPTVSSHSIIHHIQSSITSSTRLSTVLSRYVRFSFPDKSSSLLAVATTKYASNYSSKSRSTSLNFWRFIFRNCQKFSDIDLGSRWSHRSQLLIELNHVGAKSDSLSSLYNIMFPHPRKVVAPKNNPNESNAMVFENKSGVTFKKFVSIEVKHGNDTHVLDANFPMSNLRRFSPKADRYFTSNPGEMKHAIKASPHIPYDSMPYHRVIDLIRATKDHSRDPKRNNIPLKVTGLSLSQIVQVLWICQVGYSSLFSLNSPMLHWV